MEKIGLNKNLAEIFAALNFFLNSFSLGMFNVRFYLTGRFPLKALMPAPEK